MAPATEQSLAETALLDGRPPAMDRFSYLTLIETHLSPAVLPTLHTVLQDARLTQELGWDLVDLLVPLLPGSEDCLDTVARLGNPREVILKVLEVLEGLGRADDASDGEDEGEDADKDGDDATDRTFVALLGMLALLHQRLKTKYPSRFLETSLRTILAAYHPGRPAMTTAVLGLVRLLSARPRPAPPIRRSESNLSVMAGPALTKTQSGSAIGQVGADHAGTAAAAVSAPDPEADDDVAPSESALQQRLLQSFVTCILDAFLNHGGNDMAWAPRLVEFYGPGRLVPGRPTQLQAFRDEPGKIARDQAVSQMVALALDLGLQYDDRLVQSVATGRGCVARPFAALSDDIASKAAQDVPLATGGVLGLLAYWVFATDVFKSDAALPRLRAFPDHHAMLARFFGDNAAGLVARAPGTVDALVALGLWLEHHRLLVDDADTDAGTGVKPDFAGYHHQLTLCAVFHPSLAVRNAATILAGAVLHADPDAEDRLKILQDLLENCMFASLKACAVTWLREELVAAKDDKDALFGTAEAVEQLQYSVFPDLEEMQVAWTRAEGKAVADDAALLEYWLQNAPFLLQAANFAVFLFGGDAFRAIVPPGMGAAIEQRYVEPLLQAAARLQTLLGNDDGDDDTAPPHTRLDLEMLASRLGSIKFA